VTPPWGRYVAGVVAELAPDVGLRGSLETDIPIGAGLSSSAALEVAVALALGANPDPRELAALCRRAEHRATGVPCGIMDQLTVASGIAEHALLIDCHSLAVTPVPVPGDVEVIVLFVMQRALASSFYGQRVTECSAAEAIVGPLREASVESLEAIDDRIVRARATHVVRENQRVRDFAETLRIGALEAAGRLMVESHESLRDLFATSTPEMDAAVAQLCARPGVYGARMTGGGFGGGAVALTEPGALSIGWVVRPVDGAQMAVRE